MGRDREERKNAGSGAAAPARPHQGEEFRLDEKDQKPTPKLESLEPEVDEGGLDDTLTEWNGHFTVIKLARAVIRDQKLAGPGIPCIDCGSPEHSFHLRASKDERGRWMGPEASHAPDLIASGVVAGTAAKRERDVKQAAVEVARGVHAPEERDSDGKVIRRPFPELAELTMRDHQRTWQPALAGGPEAVVKREKAERREAVGEQEKAAKQLGQAIREAIFGDADPSLVFAGAGLTKAVGDVPIATGRHESPQGKVDDLPDKEE